ncbi:YciI family protein [Phaeovulum sp.]|uniref:YciI family protein n=1 Tax=Phaeovulum sp. TaxID=2934796 RepID=UPI00356678D5
MYFALICRDKPGALDTRLATRPEHLAYIEATDIVRQAGALVEGGQVVGSLIVLEAASLAEAEAWAAGDPYSAAGLFESVSISEWRKVVG